MRSEPGWIADCKGDGFRPLGVQKVGVVLCCVVCFGRGAAGKKEQAAPSGGCNLEPQPAREDRGLVRGATGIGSFFRPLTCAQPPSLRKPCGGNPERFYPSQCLERRCCHANGTCYHRATDAPHQRRNAGILGGICVGAAGLFLCVCVACRLKGSRAAGKEAGEPKSKSDAELADYLMKLLEESDQEEEERMEPREEEPKEAGE
ncbi:unnamed protein product [Eretmochelys imbricata]